MIRDRAAALSDHTGSASAAGAKPRSHTLTRLIQTPSLIPLTAAPRPEWLSGSAHVHIAWSQGIQPHRRRGSQEGGELWHRSESMHCLSACRQPPAEVREEGTRRCAPGSHQLVRSWCMPVLPGEACGPLCWLETEMAARRGRGSLWPRWSNCCALTGQRLQCRGRLRPRERQGHSAFKARDVTAKVSLQSQTSWPGK